ncbi:hypothetical protein KKE03_04825 [Patescibacteria group bacterium]|nr:hypothetical protein [Patescibacteria group bacterium]
MQSSVIERIKEPGYQFPFSSVIMPVSDIILVGFSRKPEQELSVGQRRAIIVKALGNGLNLPLNYLIRLIQDNLAAGGSATTLLQYSRIGGTVGLFEANLSELTAIMETRKAVARNPYAGRQGRFKSL